MSLSILLLILFILSPDPTAETVVQIKFVAYGVIAYIIVGVGIVGNVLSLVVLTRPNLKVRCCFYGGFPKIIFIRWPMAILSKLHFWIETCFQKNILPNSV